MREFVPYKVAVRLQDAISFSTRLDARDDSLKLSDKTIAILDKREERLKPIFNEISMKRKELIELENSLKKRMSL